MNKKLNFLPIMVALVFALVGCSKNMGPLTADSFTVNPSPLVVQAGEVPATITGKFPEKYFNKNATVVATPYLVYEGGEAVGASYTYQGEKVQGNEQAISYKMGGTITMKTTFKYVPAMRKSELYLGFRVTKGSKSYDLPRVKIAEGVISTAEISNADEVTPAIAADKFQRIIKENYQADILFLIQQANIRANQTSAEGMKNFQSTLASAASAQNRKINEVKISSYASPDGGLELNTKLAEKREGETTKYMKDQMKKGKVNSELVGEYTAQDWDGFKQLVEKSNIQDKELILRVLSMYNEPEQREKEIKNMSATFKVLAEEVLPQLRYSRISAAIDVIGKSDEEIAKLANSDAKALTIDELLYAATLTSDKNKKDAIYAKAIEIYPNDYRAYNNRGMIAFEKGDAKSAQSWFEKANKIAPNTPEVQMNLGLVCLSQNNLAGAEQAFGKSAGVSELGEALGVLYLEKGEYAKAVKSFGDSKSNNAALSQILTKDYNKAKNTLSAISAPNATTYYLMAVVGARTNNEQMVLSNLKKSIAADSKMAKQAATDLEFAKFNIASVAK